MNVRVLVPESVRFAVTTDDARFGATITPSNLFALSLLALASIKLVAVLDSFGVEIPLIRPVVGVVFLLFVPGLFVLLWLDIDHETATTTVCYAFGLSLVVVMFAGAAMSVFLPRFGLARPLSLDPLLVAGLFGSLLAKWRSSGEFHVALSRERVAHPVVLSLLLLPLVSVLGSVLYHVTGVNLLLLGLLATVAALPVFAVLFGRRSWYFPLALWCVSLALLYHGRVIQYYTFTQPLPAVTMAQGHWVPNHPDGLGSLLANGVLYPVYAIVTGLPIAVEWNLVNPVIVSFLPVTLYATFRRHVDATDALLAVCLFVFAYPFFALFPTGGRAATPVVFIALLGLAYGDDSVPVTVRHGLLLTFGAGIGVTHYGTSYLVIFALLSAATTYVALKLLLRIDVREFVRAASARRRPSLDHLRADDDRLSDLPQPRLLRPSFLVFYSVFVVAWYLYTAQSVKFDILPKKIIDAVEGVLYGQTTGSAATSFQQTYQAQSITIAKYLYVVFGLLMIVGIAAAGIRLLVYRDEDVDVEFLALGVGFLSMFVGSILPSGNAFAVARVMMIIFTFSVPFAVVGARAGGEATETVGDRLFGDNSGRFTVPSRSVFAVVIALFFLLNSGFVAETVTDGYAPSNRVSEERLLESDDPNLRLRPRACVSCDIQTHLWVAKHVSSDQNVYSDRIAAVQHDFYAGSLQEASDGGPKYIELRRNDTDHPPDSYLVLLAHNTDLGGFSIGYKYDFYRRDMLTFAHGNRIYTNGYASVAYNPPRNTTVGQQ